MPLWWPDRERVSLTLDAIRLYLFRPKIRDGDIRPLAGNHVMIQSASAVALLAHLRRGSLAVKSGEQVRTGQIIGAVGNSGNSLVPHLSWSEITSARPD